MKKDLLIAFSCITLALGTGACSKAYTCHCVYKDNGTTTHEDNIKITEEDKDKSAAACNQLDAITPTVVSGATVVSTTECELK